MTHASKDRLVASDAKEDLVQSVLAVLERSYTMNGPPDASRALVEFFRALDEATLRAIAYQHGVFEGAEAEPEREDRDEA